LCVASLLKKKLFLAFGAIIVAFSLTLLYMQYDFDNISGLLDAMVTQDYPANTAAHELERVA
jgi:hypothetical protein